MKRKYRYGGGVDIAHSRQFDKMKIQPPVFASVADAYLHMVRHPEEMEVTENDEGYIPVYNSTDDFFDRMADIEFERSSTSVGGSVSEEEVVGSEGSRPSSSGETEPVREPDPSGDPTPE